MKRVKKQTKVASKKRKPARRQTPNTADTDYNNISDTGSGLDYLELPPTVRFSATIHTRRKADPNWMEKLDIDRVPDPKGLVRALVTAADCVRLLNQGLEVHLHQAYPVQPLNPALIESDESFRRWLDKRMKTIKGTKKQKGSKDA
jgi:hypothetical protein